MKTSYPTRKNIRLSGYDYSQEGLYFVTICVQNQINLFGKISDGKMILNDAGQMVVRWYHKTSEKFPDIQCLEMVVMPNHFHCIWQNVGADPRVRPNKPETNAGETNAGEHVGSPLPAVVRWFKTMTTNEYITGVKKLGWLPFNKHLWQRNYYEHIIRDDRALAAICNYILQNPANWTKDCLNAKID